MNAYETRYWVMPEARKDDMMVLSLVNSDMTRNRNYTYYIRRCCI